MLNLSRNQYVYCLQVSLGAVFPLFLGLHFCVEIMVGAMDHYMCTSWSLPVVRILW